MQYFIDKCYISVIDVQLFVVLGQPVTMTTSISNTIRQFVNGLKSRNEEVRLKAAYDLKVYMSTELKEALADDSTNFVEEFSHQILEMVQSQDVSEKKGGILAIGKFIF